MWTELNAPTVVRKYLEQGRPAENAACQQITLYHSDLHQVPLANICITYKCPTTQNMNKPCHMEVTIELKCDGVI